MDAQGLTLEVLADRSGLPMQTLSRVERRRIAPSIRSLERVARGLGVPLTTLFSEEAVKVVSGEGIPPEVRGIALRLVGQPPRTLKKVARIVDVLVVDDAEQAPAEHDPVGRTDVPARVTAYVDHVLATLRRIDRHFLARGDRALPAPRCARTGAQAVPDGNESVAARRVSSLAPPGSRLDRLWLRLDPGWIGSGSARIPAGSPLAPPGSRLDRSGPTLEPPGINPVISGLAAAHIGVARFAMHPIPVPVIWESPSLLDTFLEVAAIRGGWLTLAVYDTAGKEKTLGRTPVDRAKATRAWVRKTAHRDREDRSIVITGIGAS